MLQTYRIKATEYSIIESQIFFVAESSYKDQYRHCFKFY